MGHELTNEQRIELNKINNKIEKIRNRIPLLFVYNYRVTWKFYRNSELIDQWSIDFVKSSSADEFIKLLRKKATYENLYVDVLKETFLTEKGKRIIKQYKRGYKRRW